MGSTQQTKKQSRPIEADILDDDALYDTRSRSSVRRYRASQPVRPMRASQPIQAAEPEVPEVEERDTLGDPVLQTPIIQRRRSSMNAKPNQSSGGTSNAVPATPKVKITAPVKRSPLVFVLIGVVVAILLVMTLAALSSWWRTYQDDLHYGRPRTSQLDAVVGHHDSAANPTHFIFLNLHRHVQIIEIPGDNAALTRIYSGPTLFGDGQDLTPVTGEVRDVNHDGKPDLIIHIQDQQIIYLNDGIMFHSQ